MTKCEYGILQNPPKSCDNEAKYLFNGPKPVKYCPMHYFEMKEILKTFRELNNK